MGLVYSPNAPRYRPGYGLIGVSATAAEVNLQRPLWRRLSATAGVGYAHYGGPESDGYVYWSIGAAVDLAPVSLVLSYVDTTAQAKALFYNDAAAGIWTGTVIWRF